MGYMTMDESVTVDLLGSPDLSPIRPPETKLQPPLIPLGGGDMTPQAEGAQSTEITPVQEDSSLLPNG